MKRVERGKAPGQVRVENSGRRLPRPRVYADANVPARLVAYMRSRLEWDVLFVLEEEPLRRAPDLKHFRLARQLQRTLITMDRDYLDDRRFPPGETSGVLVINAPNERQMLALIVRVDRVLFRAEEATPPDLPLAGRKLQVHTDWERS